MSNDATITMIHDAMQQGFTRLDTRLNGVDARLEENARRQSDIEASVAALRATIDRFACMEEKRCITPGPLSEADQTVGQFLVSASVSALRYIIVGAIAGLLTLGVLRVHEAEAGESPPESTTSGE